MTASIPAIGTLACVIIDGVDARRFAQAQFSGNVDALAAGHWQWNAWLSPQGRVRALLHLADVGAGTLVAVLRGGNADAIRAALAPFLLRTNATLETRTCTGRAGVAAAAGTAGITTDGTISLGYGTRSLVLESGAAPVDAPARDGWRLEDIRLGWPTLPGDDAIFLPPALGLEHLGAVAFDKGCYPGQEMAARLHYRGGHKQRLFHVRGAAAAFSGAIGDERWRVLDAVAARGMVDVLVVAPADMCAEINILDNIYHVVTRFDT